MSTIISVNITLFNGVTTNQTSVINPSLVSSSEAFGSQTIVRYRSRIAAPSSRRVGTNDVDEGSRINRNTLDSIVVNETFATFKARTSDYNAGVYICVPVIVEGDFVNQTLAVDSIVFVDNNPSVMGQSVIQYIKNNQIVQLGINLAVAQIVALANANQSGVKYPARLATTSNIDLSSAPANIDGVAAVVGDRILVKNQTLGQDNGIYDWNGEAVAMTRSSDFDTDSEVFAGAMVVVTEGTVGADLVYELSTDNPIVVGTTPLTFIVLGGVPAVTPTLAQVLDQGDIANLLGDINDSFNKLSININNRILYGQTGPFAFPSVNYNTRELLLSDSTVTVDWDSQVLRDSSNNISVDWLTKTLGDLNGELSVQWNDRKLYYMDGTTVSINYQASLLINSSGGIQLDWENKQINGTWQYLDTNQGAGKVMTSDASGNMSWQAPAGGASPFEETGTSARRVGNTGTISGANSTALGNFSGTEHLGEVAHSSFSFSGAGGDAQTMNCTLGITTVDDMFTTIPKALRLDGVPGVLFLSIPTDTVWKFTVDVVGVRASDGAVVSRQLQGVIKKLGTTVTVLSNTLPAGSFTTQSAQDGALTTATATIDQTASAANQELAIWVTGQTSSTIKWVANAHLVQLKF